MERSHTIPIEWPDGRRGVVEPGGDWLVCARRAGINIPTGCLAGSCGACEIEVNGRIVRACIATVPRPRSGALTVRLACDPFW